MELREIELKMSEMCDLLGVSAQGIRMYEKHGAIHSFKLEENGYRYYYFEDIGPAVQMRSMRKFGIPLSECSKACTGQSLTELEGSLKDCRKRLEENIRYEQAMLKKIDQMTEAAAWSVEHVHEFKEFAPELEREEIKYLPKESCIGGVIRVGTQAEDYFSIIKPGLDYMQKEGYELTGDIYSVLVAAKIEQGEELSDYYYIWYPCRKIC